MRILLLGCAGQVGHELRGPLATLGSVTAPGRDKLDLADADGLRSCIRDLLPDVVVNCAAYNAVDDAERNAGEAMRINGDAVALLGEEAKARRFGLVTFSSDYVFDGVTSRPLGENDPARPLNQYGVSKLAGERALFELDAPALILRTAWVWSAGPRGFVATILRLARSQERLRVVDDQVGNPTFARDLAFAVGAILHELRRDPHGSIRDARGIYHLAGATPASRHALATAALAHDPRRAEHLARFVEAVPSSEMPTEAPRPAHAVLDCTKVRERFGVSLPGYLDALPRALTEGALPAAARIATPLP
ncbi:MAG: dTDP-4-dehydrorhamnose reductase [Deltaproteobacteria bacterium]|nr:dTDP-4-dehydrorhamnose reductase [Deltaproteobacteria bacterium]